MLVIIYFSEIILIKMSTLSCFIWSQETKLKLSDTLPRSTAIERRYGGI